MSSWGSLAGGIGVCAAGFLKSTLGLRGVFVGITGLVEVAALILIISLLRFPRAKLKRPTKASLHRGDIGAPEAYLISNLPSSIWRGMNRARLLFVAALLMSHTGSFAADSGPSVPVDQPPRVIKTVGPEYPESLASASNSGTVVLDLTIDKDGGVKDVKVISSSHHDFEASAVAAALQWKFLPGRKNGAAVDAHIAITVNFQTNGLRGGYVPWHFPAHGSETLPLEYQYDTPPQVLLTCAPVYPFDLLLKGIQGSATVGFIIDPLGHPRRVTVKKASNPEFGAAAQAMISAWKFEPARKAGQPCYAMLAKVQTFDTDDRDTAVSLSALRLLRALRKNPAAVLPNMHELDSPLQVLYRVAPTVPEALDTANQPASASIQFVVDQEGRVQLPRVVSASREDFGWAAAMAVAQWQFSVPTKGHKPVDVYAILPFKYRPSPTDPVAPKS
jgi:TonB family protein